jgi:WD40 repeat protein
MRARLIASVLTILALAGPALAQNDRRDRQNPELVVDGGGRLGSCDAIRFTRDGKYLLAIGDDKVVRCWPFDPDRRLLQTEGMQVLRWTIWREQRGAIFALALSPDEGNKHVAIAGLGQPASTVVVLDRATGKMLHRTVAGTPKGEKDPNAIWSLAYAPDGQRIAFGDSLGGVWLCDLTAKKNKQGELPCSRLYQHPAPKSGDETKDTNVVRLVHFFGKNQLYSLAEDGSARLCDLDTSEVKKMKSFDNEGFDIFHATVSPDGNWFAAVTKGPVILLRSVDGDSKKSHKLRLGRDSLEFGRAVAFDPTSKRLAVTIGRTLRQDFYMEDEDRVVFYDVKDGATTKEIENSAHKGPDGLYRAWRIAFHPNGKDITIAEGENHEVKLWRLNEKTKCLDPDAKPVSVMTGAGRALWDVEISEDGKQIGFRDQRKAHWEKPNERAEGPWRVFNLEDRDWADPTKFPMAKRYDKLDDWTVTAVQKDPFVWYAVPKGGKPQPLPLNRKQDGMPRCWTFIPTPKGKPQLLAVGHLWGVSIFELRPDARPKRVRLLTGHQADVTALAVSGDRKVLVSASSDNTISGWSLTTNFPSQRVLGASFEIDGNTLVVKAVDTASPAWEAGLVVGDVVESFHFKGDKATMPGGPAAWKAQLEKPEPGVEHGFVIRRKDETELVKLATTVRHRPLWRFYPTRDGEWVLWMWQGAYYDSSTKGDFYIGWHVNAPDPNVEPTFYRAEQFRKLFRRPGVLNKLLDTNDVAATLTYFAQGKNPLPLRFNDKEPPALTIRLSATATKDTNVTATLTARPQGDNVDFRPVRAELWINDFRIMSEDMPGDWRKKGGVLEREVTIPAAKLRAEENLLTYQVYNRAGGRSESSVTLTCTRPPAQPRLYGLLVGINKYGKSKVATPNGRGPLRNLNSACRDATALHDSLQAQKGLYQEIDLVMQLDGEATRDDILAALKTLADKVGPEDRCVIYLGGHGTFDPAKEGDDSGTWRFCCPDFDDTNAANAAKTGISDEELQAKLARIAGRKVVILDACHSGQAATENPVRPLVPSGQGPIVIAACDRNQEALENKEHGLFTAALLEALGEKFRDADTDPRDGELDARELYKYTYRQMPRLLDGVGRPAFAQVPIWFAPEGVKLYPLAKEKE